MNDRYTHSISCEYPEGCSCGASQLNHLTEQVRVLRGALHNACGTIREARLFLEGKSPVDKEEAIELMSAAEMDYSKVVAQS